MKKGLSLLLLLLMILGGGLTLSAQAKPPAEAVPTTTPNPHSRSSGGAGVTGSVSANSGITGVSPQAVCTNLISDPSFEAYTPNPSWTEDSYNFGTPLCNLTDCPDGVGPRTGSVWAWFGGTDAVTETASLFQTVTIPTNTATLQFYLQISYNSGGGVNDVFYAGIDATPVFTATALDIGTYSGYTSVAVNVSAFADGGSHDIGFEGFTSDQLVNFDLDDVSLCAFAASSKIYLPLVANSYPKSLANGDFESGPTGWAEYSFQGWPVVTPAGSLPAPTHGGSWAAWLGGDNDENGSIQQSVTIPASTPYLGYWHWINSGDSCGYDFTYVRINGAVVDQYNLCTSANTGGWVKHTVNLSAYVGRTVLVQIMVQTDASALSNLLVDDVGLKSSAVWAPEQGSANLNPDSWNAWFRKGGEVLPAGPKPELPSVKR